MWKRGLLYCLTDGGRAVAFYAASRCEGKIAHETSVTLSGGGRESGANASFTPRPGRRHIRIPYDTSSRANMHFSR